MTNDFDAQGVFHIFLFYLSVLHVVSFIASIYRFCVNISNYHLSSMQETLLWGGLGVASLQIILVGSNSSHITCITSHGHILTPTSKFHPPILLPNFWTLIRLSAAFSKKLCRPEGSGKIYSNSEREQSAP